MKKNTVFTLIELLAVIVILAVIALIITPIVTGIISKAKDSADLRSAEGYVKAGEDYFAASTLKNSPLDTNVIDNLELSAKPATGSVIVGSDGSVEMAIVINNKCYKKTSTQSIKDIEVSTDVDKCVVAYVDSSLNGADPVLVDGMIPVNIADDGSLTKADTSSEWYNYTNKKWANMVVVKADTRDGYKSATAGSSITLSDVLGYFVWIPRYKYAITEGTGSRLINVVFENKNTAKSTGTAVGTDYLTHPGFTFGTEELNGFWFAKFETTGDATTPTVLPSVASLRFQNVSTQFTTSQKFNSTTYLNGSADSHMVMNKEWGAVAYLVNSIYGRCVGATCTEVSINNSSSYITGSSGGNPDASQSDTVYAYNTTNGFLATTTGNITGIYDMSGGAWEYVMGDLLDGTNKPRSGYNSSYNSGYTGTLYDNTTYTGIAFPDSKYYQTYSGTTATTGCNGGICYGDALSETVGWNDDYAYYVNSSCPWFTRGGIYGHGSGAGVFAFNSVNGLAGSDASFRVVFVP